MVRTSTNAISPWRINRGLLAFVFVTSAFQAGSVPADTETGAVKSASASTKAPHPLDPALKMAQDSLQFSQTQVRDYTAILSKRGRVDGTLNEYQHAYIKIRNRRTDGERVTTPMSVYIRFLKPDSVSGREVIWVEGRNSGQLVVHEGGLKNLIRLNLDPNGSLAMRGQRYPITEIGVEKLLLKMIEHGHRDRAHDECQVDFFRGAKVNERKCSMVQIVHPVQRSHFEYHRAQVFFDDEWRVPVRYASWSWPTEPGGQPVLEEEYNYTQMQFNVGLTDLDFDPENPAYNF